MYVAFVFIFHNLHQLYILHFSKKKKIISPFTIKVWIFQNLLCTFSTLINNFQNKSCRFSFLWKRNFILMNFHLNFKDSISTFISKRKWMFSSFPFPKESDSFRRAVSRVSHNWASAHSWVWSDPRDSLLQLSLASGKPLGFCLFRFCCCCFVCLFSSVWNRQREQRRSCTREEDDSEVNAA